MPKMKVVDQLHVSSVGPAVMGKGTEFEVTDPVAKDLEKRGLATRVEAVAEKSEEPPTNKAEDAAPANKAEPKGRGKAKG